MSSLTQRLNAKNQANGLNVVSLFDGMACAMLALQVVGVKINNYYASEIEAAPIAVSTHNWGDKITHMGDITNWKNWKIDWSTIDLICGGSPCQGFSFAGARLEFNDPRSKLFFIYMDIYNHIKALNPDVKFLLENVKMSKKSEDVISEFLNVAPVTINSAIVSAQNRVRLYWTNISFDRNIKDRGVMLADILDDEIDPDSIQSQSWHKWWSNNKEFQTTKNYSQLANNEQKAICMTARQYASYNGNFVAIYQFPRGNNKGGIINTKGKSLTVTSSRSEQNCKAAIPKNKIKHGENYLSWENSNGKSHQQDRAYYPTTEKTGTLPACKRGDKMSIVIDETEQNYIIRRFTVRECCALQTVPWQYLLKVPFGNRGGYVAKTHLYKMLGNGWTVEVIAIIFRGILNPSANPYHQPFKPQLQPDMFSEASA